MKRLLNVLGIAAGLFAVLLAVLPVFKLSISPAIIALLIGLFAVFRAKKTNSANQIPQLIIILAVISSSIFTYKIATTKNTVGNTKQLEQREQVKEQEAIEELNDIDFSE